MEQSIILARFLGLFITILGAGAVVNPNHFRAIMREIGERHTAQFIAALIPALVGAWVVSVHNIWSNDWTILITLIGWTLLLKATFRSLLPANWVSMLHKFSNNSIISVSAGIGTLIGLYLLSKGFMP